MEFFNLNYDIKEKKMQLYSVLMSVYKKDNPIFLAKAIESILRQTLPCDQFIIVEDGPLTNDLQNVINEFANSHPTLFTIVKLSENRGLAYALNKGIDVSRNELIARMDSDDIAFPERCEKQMLRFQQDPELSLVGTETLDFCNSLEDAKPSVRPTPANLDEIKYCLKRNNPFAHPTVMYKKSVILECGGYDVSLRRVQDYDLFSKLVALGYKATNIKQPLLYYRTTQHNKSKESRKNRIQVQRKIYSQGRCSFIDFLYVFVAMKIAGLVPSFLYERLYKFLKKNA